MFEFINPIAVIVAAIASYLLGWAWYSPILWQKPWMEARGDDGSNWEKEGKKEMPKIMAYGLLNTFAISFVIAVFLAMTSVHSITEYLQVSLLLCFGFVVTTKFNDLIYTPTPPHWGRRAQMLFLIDIGYQIALFMLSAAILWYFSM